MRIHYTKYQIPIIWLCIGLFMIPSVMRTAILNYSFMEINFIGWPAIFFMYLNSRKQDNYILYRQGAKTFEYCNFILIAILFIGFGIVTINRRDYAACALYIVTILLPTFVINYEWKRGAIFRKCLDVWVNALRICCYIMFFCGVIDKLTGNYISFYFANLYNVESLLVNAESGRMVSYLGHALFSCEIFLIYYVTQYLYNTRLLKKKENVFDIFISVIGVALTASKSGIVLLLGIIIVLHANWKSRRLIPIVLLGIITIYYFGLFDVVIDRLTIGLKMGDLSSARNTALARLLANGRLSFRMFTGQNIDYGWEMTAALEYPILRWAYQFGIFVAVVLSLIVFVLPLIRLLIMKVDKAFIFGSLVIMVYVNTYNGIALQRDHMLIYCLTVFFVVNMAKYSEVDLHENLDIDARCTDIRWGTACSDNNV